MVESKLWFFQLASYKDVLGKILYGCMTFLNTNGSILSFGKKNTINHSFYMYHSITFILYAKALTLKHVLGFKEGIAQYCILLLHMRAIIL